VKPELYGSALQASPKVARASVQFARDLLTLTKPKIGSFVILAALTGALLAGGTEVDIGRSLAAALLVGAVASASCVFNQWLERDLDALMDRTRNRPLPAGRLSTLDAVLFGGILAVGGTVGLAVWFGLLVAILSLATLLLYVLIYTPLKRATSLNTAVGAIPGAMPPLLGYIAIAGAPGSWGWMLFAFVFVWQFPHFLAIAWLYRKDYAAAGMLMLPALPNAEGLAGRQALLHSLVLLPLALLPMVRGEASLVFTIPALLSGLVYVFCSATFARSETVRTARATLFSSLVYLPLLLTAALVDQALLNALPH
jgi:protoheme IX farnesyltransferase